MIHSQSSQTTTEGNGVDHLEKMTSTQLKALCKEQGLKVSGKKSELQDRLREHFLQSSQQAAVEDEFDAMSDKELRHTLGVRGLDVDGDRSKMLERLREDIEYIRQLETSMPVDEESAYRMIKEAFEAAASKGGAAQEIFAEIEAKSKEEPKFIDVKITSLGMTPDKYTVGGAPSVTADVLRGLAGDPYEDPPKYGSVRKIKGGRGGVENNCIFFFFKSTSNHFFFFL